MSARSLSNLVAVALLLFGALALSFRHNSRAEHIEAEEVSRWRLTYDIDVEIPHVDGRPIQELRVALPFETAFAEISLLQYSHAQLSPRRVRLAGHGTWELEVSTRQPGDDYEVVVTVEFNLYPVSQWSMSASLEPLTPDDRTRFLRDELNLPVRSGLGAAGIQRILQQGPRREASVGERLQWIFEFCSRDLAPVSPTDSSAASYDAVGNVLTPQLDEEPLRATPLGRARTFVTLCRAAQIPARLVTGFELRQQADAKPHVWAEVYQSNRWQPFDPEFGYAR